MSLESGTLNKFAALEANSICEEMSASSAYHIATEVNLRPARFLHGWKPVLLCYSAGLQT